MFEYKAIVKRVIDGDTIEVEIDLGFDVLRRETVRFARINAYETSLRYGQTQEEKEIGLKAKEYLKNLIEGKEVILRTFKDSGKYGRYIADVLYNEKNLNDELVSLKYAIYQEY